MRFIIFLSLLIVFASGQSGTTVFKRLNSVNVINNFNFQMQDTVTYVFGFPLTSTSSVNVSVTARRNPMTCPSFPTSFGLYLSSSATNGYHGFRVLNALAGTKQTNFTIAPSGFVFKNELAWYFVGINLPCLTSIILSVTNIIPPTNHALYFWGTNGPTITTNKREVTSPVISPIDNAPVFFTYKISGTPAVVGLANRNGKTLAAAMAHSFA